MLYGSFRRYTLRLRSDQTAEAFGKLLATDLISIGMRWLASTDVSAAPVLEMNLQEEWLRCACENEKNEHEDSKSSRIARYNVESIWS